VHEQVARKLSLIAPGLELTNVATTATRDIDDPRQKQPLVILESRITARFAETLYERLDTIAYLGNVLKADTSTSQKITRLLSTPDSTRILEIAALDQEAIPSLDGITLVRETVKAGMTCEFTTEIIARRTGDAWEVTVGALHPKNDIPRGKSIAAVAPGVKSPRILNIDNPAEADQLRALVAQAGAVLASLEKARDQHLAELAAIAKKRLDDAFAQLAPGSLFTGRLTPGSGTPLDISMHAIEQNPGDKTVTVLLRTANSWTDARTAQGALAIDTTTGLPTLTLVSEAAAALGNTGPLTGDTGTLRITLAFEDASTLSGEYNRIYNTTLTLTRVPDTERAAALAALKAAGESLLKNIAEGAIHALVVAGTENRTAEEYLLRVIKTAPDGTFEAVLESVSNSWMRKFSGRLDTNAHRSNGLPLRLRSEAGARVKKAPVGTLLHDYAVGIDFRRDGENFAGQTDNRRAITLALASPDFVAAAGINRQAARDLILGIIRENTAYDGTASLHGNDLAPERIRIRFTKVAPATGNVEAVVDSLDFPGVRRQAGGAIDFDSSLVTLKMVSDDHATKTSAARGPQAPLLQHRRSSAFDLVCAKQALGGKDTHSSGWTYTFPVENARATPVPFDVIPEADGVYAWAGERWLALTGDGIELSRGARTMLKVSSVLGSIGSVLDAKSTSANETNPEGNITIEGDDIPPTLDGAAPLLLVRGPVDDSGAVKDADAGPATCEIGALTTGKNGARSARVVLLTKTRVTFGRNGVPAKLEIFGGDKTARLVIPGRTLSAGRHLLLVSGRMYEFAVK
jgi:hypothetical protein